MEVFNVPFTFSRYCVSGFVGEDKCECWRCRKDRGLEVILRSEQESIRVSEELRCRIKP